MSKVLDPSRLDREDLGKPITVQIFQRTSKETIDSSSLQKHVGVLRYYYMSNNALMFVMDHSGHVRVSLQTSYIEVYRGEY